MSFWKKYFGSKDKKLEPQDAVKALTSSINRAFDKHIQRIQESLGSEPMMLTSLKKINSTFHQKTEMVGEKAAMSKEDGNMHSFSLCAPDTKVRLEVTTVLCNMDKACKYFSDTLSGGYIQFVDSLLFLPLIFNSPEAQDMQIFAHLVVFIDDKDGQYRVAVHLCILPHGKDNENYCPRAVWPIDLLTQQERKMLGLV